MDRFPRPFSCVAQRGVTLVVVLLILLVVTVLGIGGAQVALLGERSTRYDRDYLVASQSAEVALIDAEIDIAGTSSSKKSRVGSFIPGSGFFVDDCGTSDATQGLCLAKPLGVKPIWASVDFLDSSANPPTVQFGTYTGQAFDASDLVSGPSGIRPELPPRYIIESMEDAACTCDASAGAKSSLYRVTAIGFGPRKEIQVVMQTLFRKPRP